MLLPFFRNSAQDESKPRTDGKSIDQSYTIQPRFLGHRRRIHAFSIVILSALATVAFLVFSTPLYKQAILHFHAGFKPTTYEVILGFFAQSLKSTDDFAFDWV
jgi:hypothetical protein